jgi:hypothetical protein
MSFSDTLPSLSSSQLFPLGRSFPSLAGMPSSYLLSTLSRCPHLPLYLPLTTHHWPACTPSHSILKLVWQLPTVGQPLAICQPEWWWPLLSAQHRWSHGGCTAAALAHLPSFHYSVKWMRHVSSVGPKMGYARIVRDLYHCPGGSIMIKFCLKNLQWWY